MQRSSAASPRHDHDQEDRDRFVELLDRLLERPITALHLGSAHVGELRADDPPAKMNECARLKILLSGAQRHAVSREGRRVDITLRRNDAVFWSPLAWNVPRYERSMVFLGLVFLPDTLRVILQSPPAFARAGFVNRHYHTERPLPAVGLHLVAALSELARHPPEPALERELFQALLRVARSHLAADAPVRTRAGSDTLRRIIHYLHDHYASEVSRDAVAAALGVHPNYLSHICRAHGKRTFHDLLEGMRLERARHLLQNSDMAVASIARMCGYAAPSYFIRVFRKRFGTTPGNYRASG